MKSIKIIFTVASIALLIAVGCFLAYLFLPDNAAKTEAVVEKAEAEVSQDLPIEEQAKIEVERFKRDYGMEIATDEMIKELHIRKEYEETYQKSYPLEDVFLVKEDKELSIGDAGGAEYTDTIEKIQKYVEKYNIDESRYASMTATEELHALEVEYGPLEAEISISEDETSIEEELIKAEEQLDENQKDFE